MASVDIFGLSKSFGELKVIDDVSLRIEHGELAVFVGPSGCGKSTILRLIAGLEQADRGTIHFGGIQIDKLPPAERKIAMVFQSYALYPHMSVRENLAFGSRMARLPANAIARRVSRAAEMLQISHLLDRMPKELSGGQRQRVAIGRAITRDPKVFLFDEPLSNLDASLRLDMRIEIARLKEQLADSTMIYVTHDQVEAMTLADRIYVFNHGRVEQVGTPMELYETPRNRFVASFIGSPSMNFLNVQASISGDDLILRTGDGIIVKMSDGRHHNATDNVMTMGVRPEHVSIDRGDMLFARGRVRYLEALGGSSVIYVQVGGGETISVKSEAQTTAERGADVDLYCNSSDIHLFDSGGNRANFDRSALAISRAKEEQLGRF